MRTETETVDEEERCPGCNMTGYSFGGSLRTFIHHANGSRWCPSKATRQHYFDSRPPDGP